MKKEYLQAEIARLESIHDQLEAELVYVNGLLRSIGFPEGIASAKEAAEEIIESEGFMPNLDEKVAYIKPKKEKKKDEKK